MGDRHPDLDTGEGGGAGPDRGSPPRMPRWVKVSAIIVGVLILVAVAVALIGGGNHGPGRHQPGGNAPAGVEASEAPREHAPAEGGHR